MLLLITAILLLAAASYDGATTVRAIRRGWVEANKILDFIYRTNRPTPVQIFGVGTSIIAGEILLAFELGKHISALPAYVWSIILLAQAAGHISAGTKNLKA